MQSVTRTVPALGVAFLAGAIRPLQLYGPRLLTSGGFDVRQLGIVLPLLTVVAIGLSPIGTAVTGYVWGSATNVSDSWMRFTSAVVLAAIAGFVVLSIVMLALLTGVRSIGVGALVTQVAYSLISAFGLVSVGLVALAGAAIAEFRKPTM